jgi:hypothetical protein
MYPVDWPFLSIDISATNTLAYYNTELIASVISFMMYAREH